MARHCIREPRYVPPVQRIGEQPDLFGGPTLSHVAERQGPPKGWQRQLQKWGRCTVIADLEAAPPSVIDPPPSPSPVFLVACVAAKLDRPAPARDLYASPWFQKARAYVERQGGAWFILSAKHGLIAPETPPGQRVQAQAAKRLLRSQQGSCRQHNVEGRMPPAKRIPRCKFIPFRPISSKASGGAVGLTRERIIEALTSERALTLQGAPFAVLGAEWADEFIVLSMKPGAARKKVPLDEGLEGGRIRWGRELEFGGIIKLVDVDNDRVVVQPLEGAAPKEGETAWVFLNDFLSPLIEMWQGPMADRAAKALKRSKLDVDPIQEIRPLTPDFTDLRKRQVEAVENTAYRCSIVIGPPGTGKSYTIGAIAAYLLRRFSKARILIVGPTNVAVDTALLSIDDWLQRIGRRDLAAQVKRIGAHFDPRKYVDRPHLLAPGIAEKVNEYLVLEASEPTKAKIADYVKWKGRMDAARQNLSADIEATAASARVVGVTVATAVRWHHCLQNPRFPFVLCDEASQVLGPAAMMMAALGAQTIFAGDPQQLSPIARSDSAAVRGALTRTAFDVFAHVRTARLNEQSRMAQAFSFYGKG